MNAHNYLTGLALALALLPAACGPKGAPGVVLEPARWHMPVTNGFAE